MKIAIFYIGTGRYTIFWKDFFSSCEKYFISEAQKHYFFFTDSKDFKSDDKVTVIEQENLGWPLITCLRYRILNKLRDELSDYDYAFFFNGNMQFVNNISAEEFLPTESEGNLVAVPHSFMAKHARNCDNFPYERNSKSTAYIPYGEGKIYYQACLWGGRTDEVLKLLNVCEKMIDTDLKNNIIPIFHDESVFNKYILDKKHKILTKFYAFSVHGKPFWLLKNPKIKIIQRDKANFKFGGHAYLRGETDNKISLFGYYAEKIKSIFRWRKK